MPDTVLFEIIQFQKTLVIDQDNCRRLIIDCLCYIRNQSRDLPGGTVDKNLSANCRGHRFDPWTGKTPQELEQLKLGATTTEPVL